MINETLARNAKRAYSFSDYVEGSATASFNETVSEFEKAVNELLKGKTLTPKQSEKVEYYRDNYSKKLANFINRKNYLDASCPSVMIVGGSKFNNAKKEKQNNALDTLFKANEGITDPVNNYYYEKIKSIVTNNAIYLDDEFVIEKLTNEIETLKEEHETMKNANAYYRKHKTLNGFQEMSEQLIKETMNHIESMNKRGYAISRPFGFDTANIRRLEDRLESIKKTKERGTKEHDFIVGVKIVENTEEMRLQLFFDGRPEQSIITALKSNGFRWAPSCGAWQRQLTGNARYSLNHFIIPVLKGVQ